jgi:ATP-dependent DNA ligase
MLSRTTNGKTKVWRAWIEGMMIHIEEGTPEQLTLVIVESKNPDKELKTLRQKKIKQGYHEGVADPCAMLAYEYTKKQLLVFPVYVQPKLDGIRCLVYQVDGKWVFQSRNHTVFQSFPHLEQLPTGYILDGELYRHGLDFQTITSIVRKKDHPDLSQLQFHVYDVICEGTFEERYQTLLELPVLLTETRLAHSVEDIEQYHADCVERGYEGIMIRNPKGLYKQTRSKDLLKYKHFKTDEYQVVGHTVGKGEIAVFECQAGDKTFGVMMKATNEEKQEMLEHIQDYYGKWLTVKYQELSKDGIPRFPVGVGFRVELNSM